ncbi:hypothetical protein [Acetobacter orleanensis]|uniref:Uncharacterized protein n=1 Tax=Acetobacter orleanensis TaxID=104099 RepID=A0A4Y3TJT5_9PROT|nr:hypothetical protein [Acetobacter orleanensis]KXV62833.1 hypothetical protein AD949_08705 [Acetobacter orleanensis]GAN68064.1 hypothetical protein Abol_014_115 [Acetobacter orleanensis JCM 7639]GEB82013.1 hypothetical protein AOR01nite_04900 [Acetobacter orleanensis]
MNRVVLLVAAVICVAFVGGLTALGLSGHPPVPQAVHRDIPLAAAPVASPAAALVPVPPAGPSVTPAGTAPAAGAQPATSAPSAAALVPAGPAGPVVTATPAVSAQVPASAPAAAPAPAPSAGKTAPAAAPVPVPASPAHP